MMGKWGQYEVDMLASRANANFGKYVSWRPDPGVWKIDAITVEWTE